MPTKETSKKVTRKRTAPVTPSRKRSRNNLLTYVGLIVGGLVIAGGAILVGKLDKGQIDVASTIQASNAAAIEKARENNEVAPQVVDTRSAKPNGGLVGKGKITQPAPEPVVESASTTADTASSTEAAADEETEDTTEAPADTEAESLEETTE